MSDRCPKCSKPVYSAEERQINSRRYHIACYKCETCNKGLDSTNVSPKEAKLYCKSCYAKHFGPKGYGFGQGAGTLSMDNGDPLNPPDMRVNMGHNITSSVGVGPRCPRCNKTVYSAESRHGAGKNWHVGCFRCKECGKKLDSTTLAENTVQGEIYCEGCHKRAFGPKGYGYGAGAGALTNTGQ